MADGGRQLYLSQIYQGVICIYVAKVKETMVDLNLPM